MEGVQASGGVGLNGSRFPLRQPTCPGFLGCPLSGPVSPVCVLGTPGAGQTRTIGQPGFLLIDIFILHQKKKLKDKAMDLSLEP